MQIIRRVGLIGDLHAEDEALEFVLLACLLGLSPVGRRIAASQRGHQTWVTSVSSLKKKMS